MFLQNRSNSLLQSQTGAGQYGGMEMHARLWADGGLRKASYMGPGTDLIGRLRRGDKPISGADKVSQAHDIRYTLANGDRAAERKADEIMVAKLKDSSVDNRFNRAMGSIPIRAKMAAENKGVFPKGYMSKGPALSAEDRELVSTNLDALEMEGFGKPGHRLRQMARMQGCGNLPTPPPNLQIEVPPDMIASIRQIALSLNMPHRIDEWVHKQNLYLWYKHMGVEDAEAMQGAFGDERPWAGIVNQAMGAPATNAQNYSQQVQNEMDMQQPMELEMKAKPKRKRATMGKAAFLAKMAQGKARKRKATTKKAPKRRKIHKATRAKMTKRMKAMLRRYGKGLQLAGALKLAGTGDPDYESFDVPDDMTREGLAEHLGGSLKKLFNIEAPADLMAKLGECMSGTGKPDWSKMEDLLSGHVPV